MSNDIKMLVNFVSGVSSPEDFEKYLYSSKTMESTLELSPVAVPDNYWGSDIYHSLISLDYQDVGQLLNAQSIIEEFLDDKKIKFQHCKDFCDAYEVLLGGSPKWLEIDPTFFSKKYKDKLAGMSKKEAKRALKELLLNDFRFIKKPPTWLQSPNWPIINDIPAVFLGQINVDSYFYHNTAFYVFFDEENNKNITLKQSN